MSVSVPALPVGDLAERHGGTILGGAWGIVRRLASVAEAGAGDLAPLTNLRFLEEALRAADRGALLLIDESLAERPDVAQMTGWFHRHASFALAQMLDAAEAPAPEPVFGDGCVVGHGAIVLPGVRVGARVTIGPGAVVGAAGFGFATGPRGETRAIPHHAGVVIEDDVTIGPLCTIAAGVLNPTRIARGVRLDAQVHIGHNCEIGEGTVMAAQCGLAGSVVVGRGVMMGGQVGVADHLHIGDEARIAAKSGVIGDVPAGATFAGYPAVPRARWLRGLAELYRLASHRGPVPPSSGKMKTAPPPMGPGFIHPAAVIKRTAPRDER